MPVNDPFGGWVWWGRIPVLAVERAEVVRGGTSDLWGSPALGGAIQIVRRAPWVDVVFGTHNVGSLPALLERAHQRAGGLFRAFASSLICLR